MSAWRLQCIDLAATQAVAERLAQHLRGQFRLEESPTREALVLGLVGPLGAGKTAFVQGLVRAWANDPNFAVSSPTYAIAHTYETEPPIHHLDFYRLQSSTELTAIGYPDLYFGKSLTVVEWINQIPAAIPKSWIEIRIDFGSPGAPEELRLVEIIPHGQGHWLDSFEMKPNAEGR